MRNRADSAHPHSLTGPCEPPSLARIVLLALALFALALPIVGPLDDHHFAERSHTHGHIYLDGRTANHQHLFASSAAHLHASQPGADRTSMSWDGAGYTVYLTDPTVSLLLAVLHSPTHNAPEALRPASPRGQGSNPLAPFTVRLRQPEGRSVVPSLPPPIA